MGCAEIVLGENQGILLMLETIREISWKVFICSVNQFPKVLEKLTRKPVIPIMKCLASIFMVAFHYGNRAYSAQIGKDLLI